jgi:hypothetical protein
MTADNPLHYSDEEIAESTGEEKDSKPPSVATQLVDIAERMYTFGISDVGETYAISRSGPRVVLLLRGGRQSLRAELSREYRKATGKVAPQQALADALLTIEGIAQDAEPVPLYLRVARADGSWWLDLGDDTGRAVRVTGQGWRVEAEPPLLFKRTVLTAALPHPVAGDLAELWEWVNVAEEDRPLILAWLIAALIPEIPHPVLAISGEQGTGKSTVMKVLVRLLDETPVPDRKPPKDAESWISAANGSWIVGLENLSEIQPWLSDSICRAVTGGGDVRRKLYTDGDLAVFAFRRVIAFNGIDVGAVRGDLADRLIPIELHRIDDESRLEEDELWPAWAEVHPRLLGAILDLAAGVAAGLHSVRLARKPRMADFARVLAAVDAELGTGGLNRYVDKQRNLASESLDDDEFVLAIRAALNGSRFTGTAGELLDLAKPADDEWKPQKGWPATPRSVTKRLRRQAPVMRKAGWYVTDDGGANHQKVARWTIATPKTHSRDTRISNPLDPHPRGIPDQTDMGAGLAGLAGQESGHLSSDSRGADWRQ